jgi:hypothetical protein
MHDPEDITSQKYAWARGLLSTISQMMLFYEPEDCPPIEIVIKCVLEGYKLVLPGVYWHTFRAAEEIIAAYEEATGVITLPNTSVIAVPRPRITP